MKRTKQRLHRAACFSFMLLALFLIKTNIGFCAAPTLSWTDEAGLWNDGVTPDYGTTSDFFTFKVIYTDSDNDAPYTGYPKVHILQGGTEIDSYSMTKIGTGTDYDGTGEQYTYSTNFSLAGNDYTYYFEAKDSNEDIAGFSSPTNEHTLTVITGYVWVDDDGNDTTGEGSEGNPYQTITKGINMASSGQAVRVKAGSYSESFAMASGVHVVSDNSVGGDVQEDYENSGYYAYYGYYPKALTRANSVQLTGTITFGTFAEDVTVDGISVDYLPGPYTLDISGGSPVIKNSIIRRSSGTGRSCIKMSCSDEYTEPVIENNLLHSAEMEGIGVCVSNYTSPLIQDNEIWGTGGRGIGINPKGTPGGEVTILNNLIFNNDESGIGSTKIASNATYQLKIVIQGNTIYDNGLNPAAEERAGIDLKRSRPSGPSVEITIGGSDPSRGNTIYNNGLVGIRLDGNNLCLNPVLIQNNTIYNNGKTGILLIDVGLSGSIAEIMDNTIYGQTAAGINIGGSTYANIMYNSIYENHYGINFNMGEVLTDPDPPSSGTVNIEDNNIYSNSKAGIHVRDAITGEVTIAGNDIHDNVRGGIGIMNSCNLIINRNEIHGNQRSGIHTGGPYEVEDDYFDDTSPPCIAEGDPYPCCTGDGTGTCGFIGLADSAFLDVSQNKVYENGTSGYGGGFNIRHASGTIYNNLVYENARCGIKYGNYIDEIINNTVVDNGDRSAGSGLPIIGLPVMSLIALLAMVLQFLFAIISVRLMAGLE